MCIIAEFAPTYDSDGTTVLFDGKFVLENPNGHFSDMLNKNGYDENGAIGSVRDYYVDNSMGLYRPEFDVYGPVSLSHPSEYYDENGVNLAITEAYGLMSGQIDIAQYDTDNNGAVDMVLFYYPGYNEAEYGPSWTIWPHQATGDFGMLGSKVFNRFFCMSELRWNSGEEPAAIGTTCHEFAHALGLPDLYDTDGRNSWGANSVYECTFEYDLMCDGNYNDNGRRPPYLTSLERNMLGWMPSPDVIETAGEYTLTSIRNNTAYRIDTKREGEYFLLECRDGSGWDSGTNATGLVVFQVDQSSRELAYNATAASLWESTNSINAYYPHPCYRIVRSHISNYWADFPFYYQDFVYPGRGYTVYTPTDWDGDSVGLSLMDIAINDSQVSFRVEDDGSRLVFGYVSDIDGKPLANVTVVISRSVEPFAAAPSILSTDRVCYTNAKGFYSFELEASDTEYQIITARKEGYVSCAKNLSVTERFTRQDLTMLLQGQGQTMSLQKYSESGVLYGTDLGNGSIATGMRCTATELSEMGAVGATVSTVRFLINAIHDERVYVVIDAGDERKIIPVPSYDSSRAGRYVTVDVSAENIVIPAGKDVYIGVGIEDIDGYSPFYIISADNEHGGCYMLRNFFSEASNWTAANYSRPYDFVVSASLTLTLLAEDFATYGVSYIRISDGIPEVVPAAGKTVRSITWYVDGAVIEGSPAAVSTLSAGSHTIMARVAHYDGTVERVYYDVILE